MESLRDGLAVGARRSSPISELGKLQLLPERPYVVAEKHLRRVGKDCLVAFQASLYSVPARQVRPGQQVQVHIGPNPAGDRIHLHALTVDGGGWLATHPRATRRGTWMVDPAHWDGLPDGHTRATTVETVGPARSIRQPSRRRSRWPRC